MFTLDGFLNKNKQPTYAKNIPKRYGIATVGNP